MIRRRFLQLIGLAPAAIVASLPDQPAQAARGTWDTPDVRFLECDGSTFTSSTYPALTRILGGTTLPDIRGRVRADLC